MKVCGSGGFTTKHSTSMLMFSLSLDQRMSLFLERNSISLWPMLIASRFLLGLVFVLELVCWNGYGDCLFEGVSNGGFEVFREKICCNLFGFVGCVLCVVRDEKLMCCVVLFLLFFVCWGCQKKVRRRQYKN